MHRSPLVAEYIISATLFDFIIVVCRLAKYYIMVTLPSAESSSFSLEFLLPLSPPSMVFSSSNFLSLVHHIRYSSNNPPHPVFPEGLPPRTCPLPLQFGLAALYVWGHSCHLRCYPGFPGLEALFPGFGCLLFLC